MTRLARELTLYGLIMVAIGSCIGSGIFVTPSQIAEIIPTPALILTVWALGGIIAMTGALTFSELGALFPYAGGIYVFLREAYGGWMGFLYGWAYLLIITSGSIAVLALAFSHYLSFIIPMGETGKIIVSVTAIALLTILNVLRAKFGEIFSNIFTGLKIAGILIIIGTGILLGSGEFSFREFHTLSSPGATLSGFGVALTGVLFSYGGWQHASFLAGETANPARNVPLAMITGAIVVTIIYLLVNTGYMLLMPVSDIISSNQVAAEAVSTVIPSGGILVAAIIAVSTFGTIGIFTLSAPRIYFAMASDGLFFKGIAKVHPRFRTPVNAIIIQSVWAILLLLFWGTFENLITYTVSIEFIFYVLAAAGIYIFRKKMKDTERPYRTLGYPVTPFIFIAINTWFVINITVNRPVHMGIGLIFLAMGVPVYFFFRKKNRQQETNSADPEKIERYIEDR